MPIESVSSGTPKPVVPQAPVETPKPVTPAGPPVAAQPATPAVKGSGFETPPAKPMSITGKHVAPKANEADVRQDLKNEVAAARMAGVGPAKPVNPQAVPLEYVEKGGAVVQKGQSGDSVKQLQEALNREGAGLPTDGKYDAKMETAVRDYQKKNGLPADGKIGQETMKKLLPADADAAKKDPTLSKLDAATQKQLGDQLGKLGNDYDARNRLLDAAKGQGFQGLDKDNQKLALDQFEKHAGDPQAQQALARLAQQPGLAALDKHEQTVLLNQVGGKNDKISKSSRAHLDKIMTASDWPADAAGQKAKLQDYLKKQDFTEWHTKDGAWAGRTQKADSVTGPEAMADGPFYQSKGPADKYMVKIGAETIPVIVPQGTPKAEVDKLINTMEALPPANRQMIKQLVLEKNNNTAEPRPFDALNGAVHAYPEKSGMSEDQQKSAMIHESAHLIDAHLGKKDPNWDANWSKAMKSDLTVPGQYAKKSPAEDFAETYLTYKMTENNPKEHAEMRAMFPERFKYIDEIEKKAKAGTLGD